MAQQVVRKATIRRQHHMALTGVESLDNHGSNECVVVVRMTRDFSSDALPFTNGSYETKTRDAALIQEEDWKVITTSLDAVQKECTHEKMGGWVSAGDGNIIAAMWPKGSGMDRFFGYTVATTGLRFLRQNGTGPIGDGAVAPA